LNLKATKKAAQRAVVRIMESERKSAVGAAQDNQLALLRNLVESPLRQMQESNEAQKAMSAKIDSLQATNDTQHRTIEALRALSGENVRKPTYSQVAQTGTALLNEAEKVTIPSSPKVSSAPQSMRLDERAVSIDTGRAKVSTTDFSEIKEKLQQGIDNLGITKGLNIQFLRPGPGTRIEVVFENKAQAEKARKHTQWAKSQYQGTRVQGEKWYPVKCDMVAKQAVLDRSVADDKTLSQTVCQNFSKDNGAEGIDFTATKAHWLSKVDYKKKVGSLVIWLKSKFAADYLLKSGTAIFGATGAYRSNWDLRKKELPCFNCQKYGHKQAECKSAVSAPTAPEHTPALSALGRN
jgi:hypothetical protein